MVFRRRSQPPIDPFAHVDPALVPARFRNHVSDALANRARYERVVASMQAGPIQDRMMANQARVDAGVEAIWATVCRVRDIEQTVAALDPDRISDQLKSARRQAQAAGRETDELVDVLMARFASTQQLLNAIDDVDDRLTLLDARLGAAVASAAELQLLAGASASASIDTLDGQLADVVNDLTALRDAMSSLS